MFQNLPRIRKVLDLRRSNAAQPIKSKKTYSRKIKHKKMWVSKPTGTDLGPQRRVAQNAITSQIKNALKNVRFFTKTRRSSA